MSLRTLVFFAKTQQKGRTTGPVFSQQVRSLIGDGNQAYVDRNLPEAIRIMQEVIRIEPRAASAWSVLAQCYEDMEQGQKALQLRLWRLTFDMMRMSGTDWRGSRGNMGITNRRYTAIEMYTALTRQMSMRCGIEYRWQRRWGTFEQ